MNAGLRLAETDSNWSCETHGRKNGLIMILKMLCNILLCSPAPRALSSELRALAAAFKYDHNRLEVLSGVRKLRFVRDRAPSLCELSRTGDRHLS